mmetsp:Transcript_15506/g.31484  ORF Transcript_15506/g.31484 Transcript_15506/m.31484 type:complete len:101 (-) Transcript_15506:1945-2247(-)
MTHTHTHTHTHLPDQFWGSLTNFPSDFFSHSRFHPLTFSRTYKAIQTTLPFVFRSFILSLYCFFSLFCLEDPTIALPIDPPPLFVRDQFSDRAFFMSADK